MELPRASGVLLHPTSFPGPYGIGDLGAAAYRFADFLVEAGQRVWQVLPLGHTGYGDSPYQCFSAFAGNPMLISPQRLAEEGFLQEQDLTEPPDFPANCVDYGGVIGWKRDLLRQAFHGFQERASDEQRGAHDHFCAEQAHWLDDYALFMALKECHEYAVWTTWDDPLVHRDEAALDAARTQHSAVIDEMKFLQWTFYRQWDDLRRYANERGVTVVGDIAIYVAHDSADVWASPELYQLETSGEPAFVAGVPPDYFSKTGQRWGNPLYDWERHAETDFSWWVERVRASLRLFDILRIDHFRGFEAYWEIPAKRRTAVKGRWVPGPNAALFEALEAQLGGTLPIIAENLGLITPEVEALRKQFQLPGMAVFQFGFGHDARSSGYPIHAYTQDLIAYSGTHDNDTITGWWGRMRRHPEVRDYLKEYLATNGREFNWVVIRALMASVANTVVFPIQDILGLGNAARMNRPGRPSNNWRWRLQSGQLTTEHALRLRHLTEVFGRLGG
jgi:4-alpha-glucanotransferase